MVRRVALVMAFIGPSFPILCGRQIAPIHYQFWAFTLHNVYLDTTALLCLSGSKPHSWSGAVGSDGALASINGR